MHADLQRLLHADERLLPPFFEARHGHGGLAAERIERLTAQQAEHDLGFAFRTPAQRERGQAEAPGGSATGGSGLASWAARFDSSGSVIGFIGFRVYCPVSKEIGGDIGRVHFRQQGPRSDQDSLLGVQRRLAFEVSAN